MFKTDLQQLLIAAITLMVFTFSPLCARQSAPESEKKELSEKDEKKKKKDDEEVVMRYKITVTATGTQKETFSTPKPVEVISKEEIAEKNPNNISDLLTDLPGVDVVGVGPNQSRPIIRGLRGQQILLLEDGIRMHNARRQQDFGEIPSLVDSWNVQKVEIVRGPASVLYGSDAIGGVINILTRQADNILKGTRVHGLLGYHFDSAGNQHKGFINTFGNMEKFAFALSGSYRTADFFYAPSGDFGDINLSEDTPVSDSGVQDQGVNLKIAYNFSKDSSLNLKYGYYKANNAGFGFVEPEYYNPGSTRIQITYPFQEVQQYTVSYTNSSIDFPIADTLQLTGYFRTNNRNLNMDILIPANIPNLPDAGINLRNENYTEVDTLGFRLEGNKALFNTHTLTYGLDYYRDSSTNTDTNYTEMLGFGPSEPEVDNTPSLPNANYQSLGIFIQDDLPLFAHTELILGLRYQNVQAETEETPGLEGDELFTSKDNTFVGAANFLYSISDNVKLVVSVGRGFRSPNLIERFFNGPTSAGTGYQSRNLDLEPETSFNLDIGFKWRAKNIFVEAFYFNNTIFDGIRISPTGEEINGLPEYRNVNVDKLHLQGFEFLAQVSFELGLTITANMTVIDSKDLENPEIPYINSYSNKYNLNLRYENPNKLFWIEYHLRINGSQDQIGLEDNPIGEFIPGFTIHTIRAGVNLFRNSRLPQTVAVTLGNLTDELYAEFSNSSFFRPAPRRYITLTWSVRF